MASSRNLALPPNARRGSREPRDTDLALMCQSALNEVHPAAGRKQQELSLVLPDGTGGFTEDRPRAQLIAGGLLRVAVQLAPPGGRVRLEAALSRTTAVLRFTVLGDYAAEAPSPHDDAVAGRDMAQVRRLVTLAGGRLTLDAETYVGILLAVTLPVRVAPEIPAPRR
jgi:hypothetical protein